MTIENKVKVRIEELIAEAVELSQGDDEQRSISHDQVSRCNGWLAAANNVVQLVCKDEGAAYRVQLQKILDTRYGYVINRGVGAAAEILKSMLVDIEGGLLASVADIARAETFDNFLDHAKAYFNDSLKQESGVIAGVVFEDSIRRVCEKNNIEQTGKKLDSLISELAKAGVISQTKAKRARVSAHVRTKATHASWEEFDLNDVGVTIEFTEELILNHIDS